MIENDMIQEFYSKGFTGVLELFCDVDILFAGVQSADWVVMGNYNGRCPVSYRIGKDLPGVNLGLIDQTDRDDPSSNHLICPVN